MTQGKYKLIKDLENEDYYLFDLQEDNTEQNNIIVPRRIPANSSKEWNL